MLVSESLNGITHAMEGCQTGSHSETGSQSRLPEDIGRDTALKLIEEIIKVNDSLINTLINNLIIGWSSRQWSTMYTTTIYGSYTS